VPIFHFTFNFTLTLSLFNNKNMFLFHCLKNIEVYLLSNLYGLHHKNIFQKHRFSYETQKNSNLNHFNKAYGGLALNLNEKLEKCEKNNTMARLWVR